MHLYIRLLSKEKGLVAGSRYKLTAPGNQAFLRSIRNGNYFQLALSRQV